MLSKGTYPFGLEFTDSAASCQRPICSTGDPLCQVPSSTRVGRAVVIASEADHWNSNFSSFLKHMPSAPTRWQCCFIGEPTCARFCQKTLKTSFPFVICYSPSSPLFYSLYSYPTLFISHRPFFSPLLHHDVASSGPSSLLRKEDKAT